MLDDMQGIYKSATEYYDAGKREGADEAFRSISFALSKLSSEYETRGDADAFHAAEKACLEARQAIEYVRSRFKLEAAKPEGSS